MQFSLRRYLFVVITIISLLLSFGTATWAENDNVKVILDSKEVTFPDQKPFIDENNRTLVPVRFVSEAMGSVVSWDQATKTVTIIQNETTILLKMNDSQAKVNGQIKRFDTKAILKNSRMMVPLRFISEVLGADVDYTNAKQAFTVYVVSKSNQSRRSSSSSGFSNSRGYILSTTIKPSDEKQTVSYNNQVELTIPAGFSDSPETLKIKKVDNVTASNEGEFEHISDVLDIEFGDNKFDENIFIEITYDPNEIDENEGVFAGYIDESSNEWVIVPAAIDTERNVVIIPTEHLSTWGVLTVAEGKAADEFIPAPLNLDFVEYQMEGEVTDSGYIPSPLEFSFTEGAPISLSAYTDPLPATYNSIAGIQNQTSVKDQIVSGPCWSFATMAALESYLLKNTSVTFDFSERNMMNNHGYNWAYNQGGNRDLAMGYLTRWYGPVLETDDLAFNPPTSATNGYMPDKVRKHVQDVFYIPDKDYDAIKRAIREYGAVFSTMRWGTDNSYYNVVSNAFYYNGASSADHGITIVGWDDTFSRTNFNIQPPGDGAFIIKNSWGTSFGANGYFYISYYDSVIGKENFAFTNVQDTNNYNYKYGYDPLGWTASAGYGYNNNTAWYANVFTANQGSAEQLKAVSFYTMVPNSIYEIHVNPNFAGGSPSGLVKVKEGTISFPGYHTIELDTPIDLTANSKFAVAVKMTAPGVGYPIPVELRIGGYSDAASAGAGQSYISSTGAFWSDMTGADATANVCLKAFTDEVSAEAQIAFNPTEYSVAEDGNSVSVTVERTGNTSGVLSVDYATANGTALEIVDYTAANGTLVFAEGEVSKTITINITDDLFFEGNENFYIKLSNASSGTISAATATVTINDNDSSISFHRLEYSLAEDGGTVTITANRVGVTSTAVEVDYATADGTAQAGTDYIANSGTLSFGSGETTKSFTVSINDDTLYEGDETFSVSLSNPTNGALINNGTTTVTILANDEPVISVSPATYTVAENAGNAQVIVNRSAVGSNIPVSVDYSSANVSATAGSDYTAVSGTLNFAAGENSKTIQIPILDDGTTEGDETFNIIISNAGGGAVLGDSTAVVTINDNDVGTVISFNPVTYSVNEDVGTVTLNVERTNSTSGVLTVDYATSDGTATAGSDYTVASGTLTFADGESSKTITVNITDDSIYEVSEDFTLTLSNPSSGTLNNSTATITITNEDAIPVITFNPSNYTIAEDGGTVDLIVQRNNNTAGETILDYTFENATATAGSDYVAASGTLTFADGDISKTITVAILDDNTYEDTEQFRVRLNNQTYCTFTTDAALINVTDNDVMPAQISFDSTSYSVAEDGGSATITVIRTGNTAGISTVDYATSNGSAQAGVDYTTASGTLSFASGETSKSFTVNIAADDAVTDGSKTVNLTLSNPSGAILGTQSSAVLTINDNEAPAGTIADLSLVSPNSWGASLTAGGTLNAVLHATYSGGGSTDVTTSAEWTSSNPSVATVNAGQITGVSSGNTLIKATYNGYTTQFTIVVTN